MLEADQAAPTMPLVGQVEQLQVSDVLASSEGSLGQANNTELHQCVSLILDSRQTLVELEQLDISLGEISANQWGKTILHLRSFSIAV